MSAFFSTLNPAAPPRAINMILCTAYCRSERSLSFFMGRQPVMSPGPPRCWGFTIKLRRTRVCRSPLDEWSARRRELYLTTHNTHRRQASMPPAVLEPTIPASERPQTHALYEDSCHTKIYYDEISLS